MRLHKSHMFLPRFAWLSVEPRPANRRHEQPALFGGGLGRLQDRWSVFKEGFLSD